MTKNNNEVGLVNSQLATLADVENSTTEVGDALVQLEEERDKKSNTHYTKTKHTIIICCACIILTHFITTIMLYNNGSFIFSFDSVNKLENELDGQGKEIIALKSTRQKGVEEFMSYREYKNLTIENLKNEIRVLKDQNQMLIDAQLRYTDNLASYFFLNKKSNHLHSTTREKNKNNH